MSDDVKKFLNLLLIIGGIVVVGFILYGLGESLLGVLDRHARNKKSSREAKKHLRKFKNQVDSKYKKYIHSDFAKECAKLLMKNCENYLKSNSLSSQMKYDWYVEIDCNGIFKGSQIINFYKNGYKDLNGPIEITAFAKAVVYHMTDEYYADGFYIRHKAKQKHLKKI